MERPRAKTGLADVKSNGQPMPPDFDRFESFSQDELGRTYIYLKQ